MNPILIYALGFTAQGLFSARLLVQWIASERQRRIVSPDLFWLFSLAGSILLFIYGWLRSDFSIILGQFIAYYVYVGNLRLKGVWPRWPQILRWAVLLLPVLALCNVAHDAPAFLRRFLRNEEVPLPLVVFGSAGQVIFTLRFVYQWYVSRRLRRSVLPVRFWAISLAGSGIIIAYALFRLDPVLLLGQAGGFVVYVRNIAIGHREKRNSVPESGKGADER